MLDDAFERGTVLVRERGWNPPSIIELRGVSEAQERRYVESADVLSELVFDSLDRYESDVRGTGGLQPGISGLWNQWGARKGRPAGCEPKEEADLSAALARWLQRDLMERGVVVGRELQIRHLTPTDIHVAAIRPAIGGAPPEPLAVIIEVKGCWNRDLTTAMRNQLVDRYLQPQDLRHGLYVVGWFLCDKWDAGDPRRAATPRGTLENLRDRLTMQAKALEQERQNLNVRVRVLDLTWL